MEDITTHNCTIDRVILHVVDNRREQLGLATGVIELGSDGEFQQFLAGHIAASLKDSSAAVFEGAENAVVSTSCEAIFTCDSEFVPQSQKLAKHLYENMRRRVILPGTLLLVQFGRRDRAERYLGLLKMDNNPAFIWDLQENPDGTYINVRINHQALPGGRDKLDKAAFVVPKDNRDQGYDLRVIDKKRPDEDIAGFFRSFLSCKLVQADREKTKLFMRGVESWVRTTGDKLPEEVNAEYVRQFKQGYIGGHTEINIHKFAEAMFGDKHSDYAEKLVEHLRAKGLKDAEFEVDSNATEVRRTIYEYQKSGMKVHVSLTKDAETQMVHFKSPSKPGEPYIIEIFADERREVFR